MPEPIRSPFELWHQAGGDAVEYRRLMREHGHLVPGAPEPLPCGWPAARTAPEFPSGVRHPSSPGGTGRPVALTPCAAGEGAQVEAPSPPARRAAGTGRAYPVSRGPVPGGAAYDPRHAKQKHRHKPAGTGAEENMSRYDGAGGFARAVLQAGERIVSVIGHSAHGILTVLDWVQPVVVEDRSGGSAQSTRRDS